MCVHVQYIHSLAAERKQLFEETLIESFTIKRRIRAIEKSLLKETKFLKLLALVAQEML